MRILILALLASFILNINAQKKALSLDDFVSAQTFAAERVQGLRPMKDGSSYSVLEANGTQIVRYSYATGEKTGVIAYIPNLKDTPIKSILDYEFSDDETKILVYTNRENIYRHSFIADYYVIDIARREIEPLSENGPQQAATFSPNGHAVAFVRNNNIFIKNLRFGTEAAITSDGEKNHIINGIPDWVYEEEFSFNRAFEWSPDSRELAYMRFDESHVREFSFPLYMGSSPNQSEFELYPGEYRYKYPKAGERNAKVSVHVFNLRNRTTKEMEVGGDNIYIPRIRWTTQPDQLAIVTLNRRQNQLDLYIANPSSGVARTIFTDRNERYVDYSVLDNIHFLEDGRHFAYVGELDGFNHIHLFGMDGRNIRQVTKGEWDVTNFLGFDNRNRLFYFQAAAVSPLRREIYSIRMDGTRLTRLSENEGTNMAWFSIDFSFFINEFSNTTTPPIYQVFTRNNRLIRTIEDNRAVKLRVAEYAKPTKEFFSFKNSQNVELNGYIIRPLDFSERNQYPLLLTQYSGPNSQRVLDRWEPGWEYFLATQGYIVVCVDGRGTGARGEDFRKQLYMQLGRFESEDQIETAKYMAKRPYIDADRIGIWGWSYGGYITALSMSRSEIFRTGIAVAPVTDWKFYDTAYTERYMRTPRENPSGYANFSPLNLADNLHGRLFLIHGSADDNVHYQNIMEYSNRLVQANKQFDMFIYPNRAHSLIGGNTRNHLYHMKFQFLERNLKN
ncbi:S9 family peptidase [Natronoflexus pectinivorans]|uniref:Dipeptidyl-peptidase-4 n=1 Tax=Natronoflexus pectinivorans TaxID=682526 RepID=A0A4R2G6Q0_9BACT|nr:S9 family peptidase [Natronoflexus pectinivorans]TCO03312.1 dipeptidyl-peptidase-4 [Natronoflexus pectinivorans]